MERPASTLTNSLYFSYPYPIVPKKRPRVTARGAYFDPRYMQCRQTLGYSMLQARPDGWSRSGVYKVVLEFALPARNTGDIDNLLGTVMEAGEGILWERDSQVVKVEMSKFLHTCGSGEHLTTVEVELLGNEEIGFEHRMPKSRQPKKRSVDSSA